LPTTASAAFSPCHLPYFFFSCSPGFLYSGLARDLVFNPFCVKRSEDPIHVHTATLRRCASCEESRNFLASLRYASSMVHRAASTLRSLILPILSAVFFCSFQGRSLTVFRPFDWTGWSYEPVFPVFIPLLRAAERASLFPLMSQHLNQGFLKTLFRLLPVPTGPTTCAAGLPSPFPLVFLPPLSETGVPGVAWAF